MPDCQTIEDLLNTDVVNPGIDCCDTANAIKGIALLRLNAILMDPCAFSPIVLADGTSCDGSAAISKLRLLIKCMQDICREEAESECYGVREPYQERCRHKCKRGCRCGRMY